MGARIADVAAGDVGNAVMGERDAVCHFLAPALCIQARLVPGFLAGIDMDPFFGVFGVDFCPDLHTTCISTSTT